MAGVTKHFKSIVKIGLLSIFGLFLLRFPIGAQLNLLHKFAGPTADGANPRGGVILDGTTIYGMTQSGGEYDLGTIFKLEDDGTGFSILHEFAGGADDGSGPTGDLILVGTTLFGMTNMGGDNDYGTIFKIETNGSGFSLMHEFTHYPDDGAYPYGSLLLSGSTFYGLTRHGGGNGSGTIFKMETDGSGYALLHSFYGGAYDGFNPEGSLVLSGSTLYGLTVFGGGSNAGVIFKIETDGSYFSVIHEFSGGSDNGAYPQGSLALCENTLYGMTNAGGDHDHGTIFRINTDGSGFSLIHEFAGGIDDGRLPCNSPIIDGNYLYGMTNMGGDNDKGTVFKIGINGTEFDLLHEFVGWENDGAEPYGSLMIHDSILYGMTYYGGINDNGIVFSLPSAYMKISSPNGGENWPKGSSQQVTWKSPGISGNARLVLFRDGVKTGVIATVPAAQGSYDWAAGAYIGGSAPAAKNYKIKIVTTDGTHSDWSDANFALTLAPCVRLTAPNGGESWPLGGRRQVAWDARGLTGSVRLVLYSGNSKVGAIATLPAAAGSHEWTVGEYIGGTAPAGSNYRIRIVALDAALSDFSDGPFAITTD